jgi:hypothetical protein
LIKVQIAFHEITQKIFPYKSEYSIQKMNTLSDDYIDKNNMTIRNIFGDESPHIIPSFVYPHKNQHALNNLWMNGGKFNPPSIQIPDKKIQNVENQNTSINDFLKATDKLFMETDKIEDERTKTPPSPSSSTSIGSSYHSDATTRPSSQERQLQDVRKPEQEKSNSRGELSQMWRSHSDGIKHYDKNNEKPFEKHHDKKQETYQQKFQPRSRDLSQTRFSSHKFHNEQKEDDVWDADKIAKDFFDEIEQIDDNNYCLGYKKGLWTALQILKLGGISKNPYEKIATVAEKTNIIVDKKLVKPQTSPQTSPLIATRTIQPHENNTRPSVKPQVHKNSDFMQKHEKNSSYPEPVRKEPCKFNVRGEKCPRRGICWFVHSENIENDDSMFNSCTKKR